MESTRGSEPPVDPCQDALVSGWAAEERGEGQQSSRSQTQARVSESLTPQVDYCRQFAAMSHCFEKHSRGSHGQVDATPQEVWGLVRYFRTASPLTFSLS